MKMTGSIALAAVLATATVPASAGEWVYHGGPKSPDSLTWYGPTAPYDEYYAYRNGPYGSAYGYDATPYAAGPAYGPYGPHAYGCGRATVETASTAVGNSPVRISG